MLLMKNQNKQIPGEYRILILVLILGSILITGTACGLIGGSDADDGFFYYADGEKIMLPLATDEVAVGFSVGASSKDKSKTIKSIKEMKSEDDFSDMDELDVTMVSLEPGLSEADLLKRLKDLRKDSSVSYAYPVFAFPDARLTLSNQFVVRFRDEASIQEIESFNKDNKVTVLRAMRLPDTYILSVKAGDDSLAMANFYHESDLTIYGTPDFIRFLTPMFTPNDEYYPDQWGMENSGFSILSGTRDADMDAGEAWSISKGDAETVIAIIDEGVELDHEDLDEKIIANYSAVRRDSDANPNSTRDGHGTSCAGIAAAETNNGQGVSGVCPNCSLMPVQIAFSRFNGAWVTRDSWVVDAITWAVDNGADVLSNSWGGGRASNQINSAITYAVTNGRGGLGSVVLFAAGNENRRVIYPATNQDTIAVGASSPCDERKSPSSCDGEDWWGSNYGSALDVVAPGVKWWTTDLMGPDGYDSGNYLSFMNGTSSATPAAAGVVGLILSYKPCLTGAQVQDVLEGSAEDQVGDPNEDVLGWDEYMGWGRINAHDALVLADEFSCGGVSE